MVVVYRVHDVWLLCKAKKNNKMPTNRAVTGPLGPIEIATSLS